MSYDSHKFKKLMLSTYFFCVKIILKRWFWSVNCYFDDVLRHRYIQMIDYQSFAFRLTWLSNMTFKIATSLLKVRYHNNWCYLIKVVRLPRLELGTSTLSVSRSNQLSYDRTKWRLGDSNSWPSECKSDALPTELNPHSEIKKSISRALI